MKIISKRYYHVNGTPDQNTVGLNIHDNYVVADVYYDEGGYSFATYRNRPRCYAMSVHRVGRSKANADDKFIMESTAFDFRGSNGAAKLIFEVTRQSKKREQNALDYFEANIDNFLRFVYPDLELEEADVK